MKIALSAALCLCALAALPVSLSAAVPSKAASAAAAAAKKKAAKPAPPPPPSDATIAAKWLKSLNQRERIAQLVMIPFSGHPIAKAKDYNKFVRLIQKDRVGGMIVVNLATTGALATKADPVSVANFVNRMQRMAKVPLIVGGDFERGASMRVEGTTVFPHSMAFGATRDPKTVQVEAEVTVKEARAMGVQWLFFPDADVNNNPDNPIINIRSYGENPADVSTFVKAFIEGTRDLPGLRVLTTAKHFPGHGDTNTDTHLNLASVLADRDRLEKVEWSPFRAAIQSGVDSIMSAHVAVPAIDDPALPSTLSSKVLTGILRDELAFKGIIVTDALNMKGVAGGFTVGDAAVRAIEAGADLLLMPIEPTEAIDAVLDAVKSGRISKERIDESVMRILTAKAHVGLATSKLVDTKKLKTLVNSPSSNAAAQAIADRAVTLVKNESNVLPLDATQPTAYFVLTERRNSSEGQAFIQELKKHVSNPHVTVVDNTWSEAELEAAAMREGEATRYVVAAFADFSGPSNLRGQMPKLVQNLLGTKKPVVFITLGNPYVARNYPDAAAYVMTYSTVAPSEVSAARGLFGGLTMAGRLPISIPGIGNYGDGISLAPHSVAAQADQQ